MRPLGLLFSAAVGVLAATAARADYDLAPRTILASADVVSPLGRIGAVSAVARGIDDSGRLLVQADLSDGTRGLFRTDGTQLETLWRSGQDDRLPLVYPDWAVTSPGGRVVALGLSPDGLPGQTNTLYQISPPPLRALVALGDQTTTGDTITYLYEPAAVADDGTVAILAYVRYALDTDGSPHQAALLVRDDGVHLVAGEGLAVPPERRFDSLSVIGLMPDGAALIRTSRYDTGPPFATHFGRYAAGTDDIRPIAVEGDRGSSGLALSRMGAIASAPNGEVLLRACEDRPVSTSPAGEDEDNDREGPAWCDVYRTENGQLIRIASADDRTPDGYRFIVDNGWLTDAGDAVLQVSWLDERLPEPQNHPLFSGLLFYPAGGSSRLIAAPARGGPSNAAGEIVVVPLAGEQPLGLFRWGAGQLTRIVDAETLAPDGARFIAGGLFGPRCLAADGRTASFASFVDGQQALICTDSDGPHVVARLDDLPQSRGFPFHQCGIPDGEEVVFSVHGAIYRAGPGPIAMIAGPGAVTDRGTMIADVDPYSAPFRAQTFAMNRFGTVVARARAGDGIVLVRHRRGGPLEQIALDLVDGTETVTGVLQAEVADDDTIVALARLQPDQADGEATTAIVAYGRDGGRVLFRAETLGGRPDALSVRGALASFMVDYAAAHYIYDLRNATLRRILDRGRYPELQSNPFLLDFASTGDAVFFGYARDDEQQGTLGGRWLLDGNRIRLLASEKSAEQPTTDPVALNAAGNILFEDLSSPFGGKVQHVSLSGPPPSGRCPVASANAPLPSGGEAGCQVTAATSRLSWHLVSLVLLVLARGCRGIFKSER